MLSDIPSTTICVWSSQRVVDVDYDVLTRFSQGHKTVISHESLPVDSLPEVCLHNVMFSDRQDCTWLLPATERLSVLHNFYVLVEEDWSQQCSEQFGPARVVLVLLREARVLSLSSPYFRPRRFISSNLTFDLKTSYKRPTNLKGTDLTIATFHCPPFVMFGKGNHTDLDAITGNEWEIVKSLSIHYNFTMKMVTLKGDGEWGIAVNGTAIGGISQALAEGEADIGVCNIWNVITRYSIMDFGPVMNEVTFTYIVPRPHLIPHRWLSLVNIFTVEMWLCTLLMYMFTTFCYWISCNSWSSQARVSPAESFLTMFGILTLTSWAVRTSNSSGRQLVTWWCVFVMLLTATYSSSIAARLTLPKYESRIDTVHQLVEQGFHWYDKDFPSSDKWSIYFNPTNDWQNKLKLQFKPLTEAQMLPALNTRKFAFPIQKWGGLFMYFNAKGLDYERDLVDMRVMKETTDATFVSLGFAKGSPFFRFFQGPLMWMYEAGLTSHWTSEVVRTKVDNYAKRLLQETDDVNTQKLRKLKMDNLLPAFYILGFGLFNSTLLFLVEIWYVKNKKKNLEPKHPFVL